MTETINNEKYGEIVYSESIWTGKQTISINGVTLEKQAKKLYKGMVASGEITVKVNGNIYTGLTLIVNDLDEIKAVAPPKWYDVAMSVVMCVFLMVWGNTLALCKVIPIVGGAIGGSIIGVFSVINFLIVKLQKKLWIKILISVAFLAVTFGICFGVACIILASAK